MAFGLYAMPVTISGLTTTIGGAGSVVDGTFTDFSADLRLYYKTGALSITSFHSYSALVDAEKSSKYVGNETTKGLADASAVTNGKHGGTTLKRDAILANNIMLRYKFNKTFAAYGFVADMIGFGKSEGKDVINATTGKDGKPVVQLRTGLYGQAYCGSSSISNYEVWTEFSDCTKTSDNTSICTKKQ